MVAPTISASRTVTLVVLLKRKGFRLLPLSATTRSTPSNVRFATRLSLSSSKTTGAPAAVIFTSLANLRSLSESEP